VSTVKGEANFEQETLTKVIEARAKATSIQATPELINDPEAFDKFQKAQGELSGALSRLLVVAEQYPNLRANQAFQDLRVALEGTENRITWRAIATCRRWPTTTSRRGASRPTSRR
jgi:LemA protein